MGDRMQRAKGKAEEMKGKTKMAAGRANRKPSTTAKGAVEAAKGKTKNTAGKASSAVKKATR
jgi:uncharacterized protein YjbJ (UPF0337 family)